MLFLSTVAFDAEDEARLEAAGHELLYVGTEGGDPHGMTSDDFHAALYALPEAERRRAVGLITPCFHVTSRLLTECPNIRWVHHPGAGVNSGDFWTDWDLLAEREVVVTTAKIHAGPISEWVLAMILALSKHLPCYLARQQGHIYRDSERLPLMPLEGKAALIVGAGNVGREVGRKLKCAFGMQMLGINSDGRPLEHFDRVGVLSVLSEWVSMADFIITTAVLVETTRGMINAEVLANARPTAYVVNPSRGSLIVERDLIEALQSGKIAGAALDTFEHEPLGPDSPLWDMPNVIITPHVSGGRPDYNTAVMERLLENLSAFEAGEIGRMHQVANFRRY